MPNGRKDPYPNHNFLVEIDGVSTAGFSEIGVLTTDTDAIDYREGTDLRPNVRKIAGLRKYSNVMLKRGYTQNKELWNWRKEILDGIVKRRTVGITLLDELRNPVLRWTIIEAWISKWESGPFNGKTNEILIETMELMHEGITLDD
jgi:phage tail-like protein